MPPIPSGYPEGVREWEAHVRFCWSFPGQVESAVQLCKNQALGYHSMFISTRCTSGGGSWSFGGSVKNIQISHTADASGQLCVAQSEANMLYTQDSCRLSGDAYQRVTKQHCADVP